MTVLRVVLVSRSRFAREGIARHLSQFEQLDVCSHYDDLEQALPEIVASAPDVVVIDCADRSDIDSVNAVRTVNKNLAIVVSGLDGSEQQIIECCKAGVSGYIRNEAAGTDWVDAIQAAPKGTITDGLVAGVLNRYVAASAVDYERAREPSESVNVWRSSPEVERSAARVDLTKRERQILSLVDRGLSTKQIAQQLQRSPATIKAHIQAVLAKYQVHRRSEAAAIFRNSPDAQQETTCTAGAVKDYSRY